MDTVSAITVLTAMITPAVLISACGSMILSTSVRLGRVVDRVRSLSDRWEEQAEKEEDSEVMRERSHHPIYNLVPIDGTGGNRATA